MKKVEGRDLKASNVLVLNHPSGIRMALWTREESTLILASQKDKA
jgi:hypothetical protein